MSKPQMKFETCKTTYCIELSEDDFSAIIEYDDHSDHGEALCIRLQDLSGVHNVDFDGMFGPNIFLDIEQSDDHFERRAEIKQTIWDAIQKGRPHV